MTTKRTPAKKPPALYIVTTGGDEQRVISVTSDLQEALNDLREEVEYDNTNVPIVYKAVRLKVEQSFTIKDDTDEG